MDKIDFLDLPPLFHAQGSVRLPGSKSISNRVLLLCALCEGSTTLHGLLDSDDTRVMLEALEALGCVITRKDAEHDSLTITGLGAQAHGTGTASDTSSKEAQQKSLPLFLGNAGTAMRPLVAALSILGGDYTLSGVARMHERPIGDLVDALRQIGAQIDYLGNAGYPPLRIRPCRIQAQDPITIRGDVSSQFLTAMLMALPLLAIERDVCIEVVGELISKPYIAITLRMMAQFGVEVERQAWQRFTVKAGSRYRSPGALHVEADASSASYFIALGAMASEEGIHIQGVGLDSIQGDIRFIEAAQMMGADVTGDSHSILVRRGTWPLRAIELDCNHIPDAAMTLAVMALYAQGTTRLSNIASWRVKETDRISAMCTELRKLGAEVEEGSDSISITPPLQWRSASIHTYDDHRMAMCFSLTAFNPARVRVRIEDPACTAKTFPHYFASFFSLVQTPSQHIPVITIDGPSASGKGTLASLVAQRLGYHMLDSGAIYRVCALLARRLGIAPQADNEPQLAQLAQGLQTVYQLRFEADAIWIHWDGAQEDISHAIRCEALGVAASQISVFPALRQALLHLQHAFRQLPGLVADGRDMGTVVFPDAQLKIFLRANASARAQRRHAQLAARGQSAIMADLLRDLEQRDARDQTRSNAPLVAAQDAFTLDNSTLSIEESVQWVLSKWMQ